MRLATLSLLMGLAVGLAYGLVNIRSPAPPIVALLGLLGMVAGEAAALNIKDRCFATSRDRVEDTAFTRKAGTQTELPPPALLKDHEGRTKS